ncbi:hypothetical protein [Streptomyces sp. 6N223]|uniref:hypothetical protein n=1 Tax=Streptomyces sp. 6N223 TaxID=3457412 RepID=UPI003FD28FDA
MAFGARDIKAALGRIETQLTTLTTSTLTALSSAISQGIERLAIAISSTQKSISDAQESINARISAVNTRIEAVNSDINALRYSVQTTADAREIRRDIAALHALIAEWKAEAAEARRRYEAAHQQIPPGPPTEDADPAPAGEPARTDEPSQSQLLRTAAGISSATLTCHRDLWAFFVERSAAGRHFRVPGLVKQVGDGNVEVRLSGRTIIASLTALDQVRRDHERDENEDWALASELYDAIADVVKAAGNGPRSGAEGQVVIVIDRKPGVEAQPTIAEEGGDDEGEDDEGDDSATGSESDS